MEVDDLLEKIVSASELPLKKRFNHWYYDDTFGTLAFVRKYCVDLEGRGRVIKKEG